MNENFDDDKLSERLRAWRVAAPLPAGFQERVWRQIARAESTGAKTTLWVAMVSWFEAALSRRSVAASYLAILLACGMAAGYLRGAHRSRAMDADLSARYLQSVDPYQMNAPGK